MLAVDSRAAFAHVTEQQVDDAAFLWLLWGRSAHQPHQTVQTRAKLERRINAHLSGLAFSPDIAWHRALETGEHCDAGELFVLSMLALTRGDHTSLKTVINLARTRPQAERGLISALAWAPSERVYPWLRPWVTSEDLYERYLGIAACSVRRLDPEGYLSRMLQDPINREEPKLSGRLFRLVGELKRADLAPIVMAERDTDFWAGRSALLVGDERVCEAVLPFALTESAHQTKAIDILFRTLPHEQVWECINELINTGQDAAAIQALGALGDPKGVSWLLTRMTDATLAKPAADAFTLITGADLESLGLTRLAPATAENAEEDLSFDYEHCPYPCAQKVSDYWHRVRHQFVSGRRYLMGASAAEASLDHIWLNGRQPQRRAAALEHALIAPHRPFPNASAPMSPGGAV